ncbi:MAG TPA: hypothetical protein VML75_05260 [Kofleriaceae bacterium]|nr:hypothetical protein [Kofleriaceae bacterium]
MRIIVVLPLFLVLSAGTARAQAPGLTPTTMSAQPETVQVRYGWQILLADLAAIAAGAATDEGEITLAVYLGGGPVIHLAHGNVGSAMGSLALRAGLPLAGALLGIAIEEPSCEGEFLCGFGGMIIGGTLGVLAASAIDIGVLAKKSRRVERPRGLIQVGSINANPSLAPTLDRGMSLGLSGTF